MFSVPSPPCAFFHLNVHVKEPLSVEVEVAGRAKFLEVQLLFFNERRQFRQNNYPQKVSDPRLIAEVHYSESVGNLTTRGGESLLWARNTPSTNTYAQVSVDPVH